MTLEHREKFDRVLRWFRCCAVCRTPWPPIDFLCPKCWMIAHQAQNHGEAQAQPGYPFPVFTLWTWTPQTEAVVKPLVHAFKRGWATVPARAFAQEMLARRGGENVSFVHPPASDGGYDHARLLTDCLLDELDDGEAIVLERREGDQTRQKRKNAAERSLFRFQRVEKISDERRRFIFVDDVITTGSTALAAYMALGDPKDFAVWALVARPKLAGKPGF